jgi:hypothetical protein
MESPAVWISLLSLAVAGVSAFISYRTWRADRARLHIIGRMMPYIKGKKIEIRAGVEVHNGGRRPASIRSVGFEAPDGAQIFADAVGVPHRLEESASYSATVPIARILSQKDRRLAPFAIDGVRRKHLGERWDWSRLESIAADVDSSSRSFAWDRRTRASRDLSTGRAGRAGLYSAGAWRPRNQEPPSATSCLGHQKEVLPRRRSVSRRMRTNHQR